MHACVQVTDSGGGGGDSPFLMLVNAQKIKVKSVFHKWGTPNDLKPML